MEHLVLPIGGFDFAAQWVSSNSRIPTLPRNMGWRRCFIVSWKSPVSLSSRVPCCPQLSFAILVLNSSTRLPPTVFDSVNRRVAPERQSSCWNPLLHAALVHRAQPESMWVAGATGCCPLVKPRLATSDRGLDPPARKGLPRKRNFNRIICCDTICARQRPLPLLGTVCRGNAVSKTPDPLSKIHFQTEASTPVLAINSWHQNKWRPHNSCTEKRHRLGCRD